MEYLYSTQSPLGTLTMSCNDDNITGLWIEGQKHFARNLDKDAVKQKHPLLIEAEKWLTIYFKGREPDFNLPLMPKGSQFQKSIWNILRRIPRGSTMTYGEIAKQYEAENNGIRTSARGVGNAVGRNPISIFIPCHRVIGKNGDLTGYAGGIHNKIKLLQIEGINYEKSVCK